MTTAVAAVMEHIESKRSELVELVRELVRIPSVNPRFEVGEGLNREAGVQTIVSRRLAAAGMATEPFEAFPSRALCARGDRRRLR
jgi:acetylornithine deacetylase/succinyl-diaminopimelate desuccinylase-like protein